MRTSSVVRALKSTLFAVAAWIGLTASVANAADYWWDGNGLESNVWTVLAAWATAEDGSGTPGAAPGGSDRAIFNALPYNNANVWVALPGAQSIGGLVFNNTGQTWIATSGSGNRTLTIGADGITINPGAGPVIFGTNVNNYRVLFSLSASQTWLNNSANPVDFMARSTLTLGANTLTLDGSSGWNFNANIETAGGAGSIVKNGSGVVTFSATNWMTGPFVLNAGRVRVAVAATIGAALGQGTLVLNGGALSATGTIARIISNNYVVAGNVTLGDPVDSGMLTFFGAGTLTGNRTLTIPSSVVLAGAIADGGGGYGFTKEGAGTLTLSGANTYGGNTIVNAGTLYLPAVSSLPGWNVAGRFTVAPGAILAVSNSVSESDIMTMLGTGNFAAGSRLGLDTAAGNRTFVSDITGAQGIAKLGANWLELTGNNTFSGGLDVRAGSVTLGSANAAGTGPVTIWTGLLLSNAVSSVISGAVTTMPGGTVTFGVTGGTTLTLNGAGNSFARVQKYGDGTLTINGSLNGISNILTYAGTVNLNGGASWDVPVNTVDLIQVRAASVLNINGDIFYNARMRIGYDPGITSVVNQLSGTLVSSGDYGQLIGNSGGIGVYNMYGGVLSNDAAARLTLGVTDYSTAIFNLWNGTLYTPTLEVGRNTGANAASTNYYTQAGGTATVGTLVMGRANVDSPNQVIVVAVTSGTFRVTSSWSQLVPQSGQKATMYFGPGTDIMLPAAPTTRGAGATVNITFDGNTLTPAAASTSFMTNMTSAAITLNGLTVIVPSGRDITIGQALSDAPGDNGFLVKQGPGALALMGANTFSGGVTLNNGRLDLNTPTALGTGPFTIASNGVVLGVSGLNNTTNVLTTSAPQFWNGDFSFTAAGVRGLDLGPGTVTLGGSRTVMVENNSLFVGGSIGDGGAGYSLTKVGAGSLNLYGASTYGGGTVVQNGTLRLHGAGALNGTASVTVSNGAAFVLDNSAVNLANRVPNAAPVRLDGGILVWTHAAAAFTTYEEQMGALTAAGRTNLIVTTRAAVDGDSTLTFASLSREGEARLVVEGVGLGADLRNRLIFTTAPPLVNGIIPWVLLRTATNGVGSDWHLAAYDVTDGLRPPVSYVSAEGGWSATANARPTASQTLTADRSLNALVLDDGIHLLGPAADRNLTFSGPPGAALILQTGGWSGITNSGNNGYNLQFGSNTGLIHTIGTLWITRGDDNNITIRGANGFVKTGPGTLVLQTASQAANATPANNLLGVVRIDEGVLELRRPTALGGAVLELNGGSLVISTNSGVVITSHDSTPTNTPLVVSRNATVLVARVTSGAGVTHTMGDLTLKPGVELVLNWANMDTDQTYGLRFDRVTMLGDATLNVRTGPGTGDGILYATNVTDNGNGFTLTVIGNATIRSELRVHGTLSVSNLIIGGVAASGAVVRAWDGFTNVSGNIAVRQGTLVSQFDFARELGDGPGQVRFIGGGTAGIGVGGSPAAFALTQGGVTGMLVWGAPNFEIGSLQLNEDDAGGVVTLLNDLDLYVTSGSTTRVFQVDSSVAVLPGVVTNTGAGAANVQKAGGGTLSLTGPLSWNGWTRVAGGYLRIPSPASLPPGNLNLSAANAYAVLETAGIFTRPLGNGDNQVQLIGTATGTQNSRPGFSAVGGDLIVDLGGDGTGTGPMLVWNSAFFDPEGVVATNGALLLGSSSADGVLYWKNSIDLNGTGEPDVTDRRFQVDGAGTVAVIEGAIVNNGPNPIGLQKKAAGTLVLAANNAYDGGTYVLGGTLVIGTNGSNGTLGAGSVTNLGTLVFNRGDGYAVANLIVGSGTLVQRGSGTLTLTANNEYSGPTVVSNGALRINGSHTGGGLITVAGGRLEGNGSVAGAINVLPGGTLAPGASPGQFTANANVTLQSGAIFEVELNGTTPGTLYDQLLMGSGTTLTLSNPTLSVILGYSPNLGDTFQIVSGFSALSGSFSGLPTSGSTFTVGTTQFQIDYNASDITLTVLPEPTALGLFGLAAVSVLLLRRRLC